MKERKESYIRSMEFVLSKIAEVRSLLHLAVHNDDLLRLNQLVGHYDEIFLNKSICKIVEYKITGVGNSTHAFQNMQMEGENSHRHITLKLREGFDLLDGIYGNRLSELIMLFKYLFSAVENLFIYQNKSKLSKYLQLLKDVEDELKRTIIEHSKVSFDQDLRNQRLKKQEELEEKMRIKGIKFKPDFDQYASYLSKMGINSFFHFTDRANLNSIIHHGGLCSREFCIQQGIRIPNPGGDQLSWELDKMKNATNYVRLSFCRHHPMKDAMKNKNRIKDPVVLEVDTKVMGFVGTKFCRKNASRRDALIEYDLLSFMGLPFNVFFRKREDLSDVEREGLESEVLVYRNVPLDCILNIHSLS